MRSIWNGSIGFGLVNIPVKLYSAVQDSTLDLDMLDGRDQAKIHFLRVNEHTHKEVPYDKIVRAYKLDDQYIVLDGHDFEEAAHEKTKLIEIESFVQKDEINPMYYETSYFTEPNAKNSKAYSLLLKALQKSGKAGLGRFVLRNTENLCIIHPVEDALVVTKIRFAQELRGQSELKLPSDNTVSKKELDMGMALINQYSEKFDINQFKDTYSDELLKIIKAKAKGKRATVKRLKPKAAASTDLYEQLMQSMQAKKGA